MRRIAILLALVVLTGSRASSAAPAPGWRSFPITLTGEWADRYVPTTYDPSRPAPVVVFLHGYATPPSHYRSLVEPGAEATGAVVILPRADGLGWGAEKDPSTVSESVRLVGEELPIDARRVAISGHSAGGAYAYILAYSSDEYSAVFTMAASFYPVHEVADSAYTAPIRMYYGDGDPNYQTAYPRLRTQWQALGVPFETQIEPGYPHCCWPESALVAGFEFLVGKTHAGSSVCTPSPNRLCLGGGRYGVELTWRTAAASGEGQVAPASSADAGLFWFFSPDNWEMLVKVLDGCAVNGKRWVFAAATTNVGFTLTVTDTQTGAVWTHQNPLGDAAAPVQDTGAFACP